MQAINPFHNIAKLVTMYISMELQNYALKLLISISSNNWPEWEIKDYSNIIFIEWQHYVWTSAVFIKVILRENSHEVFFLPPIKKKTKEENTQYSFLGKGYSKKYQTK